MYNAALSNRQSEVRQLASRLYREYRTYLFAIARRNVNAANGADAEEALQEAFIG
jgi:DNA-directed RNA polymerase specialized sigma24 family protein